MDPEIYDVICLSGKKASDVRERNLLKSHLERYWPLLAEGGFLMIEVSFADDHGVPPLDWEDNHVPWLEKNLQEINPGGMTIVWLPVPSRERGILALQKGGPR